MWEAQDKLVAFSKFIMLATYFAEAMSCLQYICHLITGSSTAYSGDPATGGLFPSGMKSKILVPQLTSSTAVAESDTDKMK